MRVKELEQHLSQLKGFGKPKIIFEQYATDAHLASRLLHVAHTSYDDIEGKSVLDLGCGCGMLSIGAMMLGSEANVGIDIDPDALEIFRENMDRVFDEDEMPTVEFINADVVKLAEDWLTGTSFARPQTKFDTVLLNPPFGTKSNAGIDMLFLQQAVAMCTGAVYSMHKSSTREYILRKAKESWGVGGAEVIAQLKFDLPATYKFHKKEKICQHSRYDPSLLLSYDHPVEGTWAGHQSMFGRHLRGLLRLGPIEFGRQVLRLNEFRGGSLLATDKHGNRYYEVLGEPDTLFYRRRYVEYGKKNYDASQVPSEWHAWLHYITDEAPTRGTYIEPKYQAAAVTENLSGTPQRYVPYSTTTRKIVRFDPSKRVQSVDEIRNAGGHKP